MSATYFGILPHDFSAGFHLDVIASFKFGEMWPMKFKFLDAILIATSLAAIFVPQHSRAQDATRRIEIVAKRFEFTPADITLKKGVPVVLVLTSKDVAHGVKFKGLNLTVKAKKGSASEVRFHAN